jgi:exosortase/archaeosortase family protein
MQELAIWCVILAAIAFWGEVIAASLDRSLPIPVAIAQSVFAAGAFGVAAWAMILVRCGQLVADRPARKSLVAAALGVGLLCAIPAPLHVMVGHLDAHALALVSGLAGLPVTVDGNVAMAGDFGVEILATCTSSSQLPDVILAFVVVVLYRRGALRWADLPFLIAALVVSVVLNEIRLAFMVRNEAAYQWWHEGTGATVYGLAALTSAVAFPLLATARRVRAPAVQAA